MGYSDEDFDRAKAVQERNGKYYKALYDQAGNSIAAGGENLQDALLKVGISAKEALTAFESIYRLRRQEKSNNWRKYHGLPLKRSKGGKRRGDRKRNDSNSENTGIS